MNNKEVFFPNKIKRVLLYGAASIGMLIYNVFEENNFEIIGYIDKRAKEMDSFMGKPVWSLHDDSLKKHINDNAFVFVSVKNVFEHSKIAQDLVAAGFENIIYRPYSVLSGDGNEAQKALNSIYDLLTNDMFHSITGVPKTMRIETIEYKDYATIRVDEQGRVVLVPIDLVYSDNKVRETPWFNKNIGTLLPHMDLFRFIAGESGYSTERYMDFCIDSASNTGEITITQAWKNNVLKNRSSIYEHMSYSMELDPDFFIRNAPNATWNKNGYFNLNSGKHRGAFFASKRKKYVPLRISEKDFEAWINEATFLKVKQTLERNAIHELCAPIPHPYFYQYPCESKEFYFNLFYAITYYLANELYTQYRSLLFEGLRILCICDDLGYLERHLIKMGCKVDCVNKEEDKDVLEKLQNLFYCLQNHTEFDLNKSYDYILYDETRNEIDITTVLNMSAKQIFFLCEEEHHMHGYFYKKLFSSMINGKIKYAYVIRKE